MESLAESIRRKASERGSTVIGVMQIFGRLFVIVGTLGALGLGIIGYDAGNDPRGFSWTFNQTVLLYWLGGLVSFASCIWFAFVSHGIEVMLRLLGADEPDWF